MTPKIFFLVFLVELFDASSQILFKQAVNKLEATDPHGLEGHLSFFLRILRVPGVWCGVFLVACGLLLWFTVLAQADLSLVFPFNSIQYLLVMVASYYFLGEKSTWTRLLGTCCITVGIICVSLS